MSTGETDTKTIVKIPLRNSIQIENLLQSSMSVNLLSLLQKSSEVSLWFVINLILSYTSQTMRGSLGMKEKVETTKRDDG